MLLYSNKVDVQMMVGLEIEITMHKYLDIDATDERPRSASATHLSSGCSHLRKIPSAVAIMTFSWIPPTVQWFREGPVGDCKHQTHDE